MHGRHTATNARGDFALSITFEQLRDIGYWARENDLSELQTGFAVMAMDSMGNRGKNLREGTVSYMFVHTYPRQNYGDGMTGIVIKNVNGHKGREGETLYSACIPHVRANLELYSTLMV